MKRQRIGPVVLAAGLIACFGCNSESGNPPVIWFFVFWAFLFGYLWNEKDRKRRQDLGDRITNLPIEGNEVIRYSRIVGSTDGIVFSFAATDRAVYILGDRIALGDIRHAGVAPSDWKIFVRLWPVYLGALLLLFFLLSCWTDTEIATVSVGLMSACLVIVLGVSTLSERRNRRITLVVQLRQKKRPILYEYRHLNATGELITEIIEAYEEAAAVLAHIGVPSLPARK